MARMSAMTAKLRGAVTPAGVTGLWGFWRSVSGAGAREIAGEAARPVHLVLVGTGDQARLLASRLALESPVPQDTAEGPPDITPWLSHHGGAQEAPPWSIVLDADALNADEPGLARSLAAIVQGHPDLRLALARNVPAFRPAVAASLIQEASWGNARTAVLTALPGVIPFTDVLMPLTAAGDMVMLTRNQVLLLLRIAAAYGRDTDLRARARELLPVVGSAFGWRALARELLGLVPGGIGVVVKGAVAYAGTYTVGKGAAIFYSTGRTLPDARLRQLYKASFREALTRIRQFVKREKAGPEAGLEPGRQGKIATP